MLAVAVPAHAVESLRVRILRGERSDVLPGLPSIASHGDTLPSNTLIVLSPLTDTKKAPSGE